MELKDFTPAKARDVMKLWKKHLGFFYAKNSYLRYPEILSSFVQDPKYWVTGRYEDRVGSKYTDDSKLIVRSNQGKLEISCYVQAHTVMGRERIKEAEEAEEAFNLAAKEL